MHRNRSIKSPRQHKHFQTRTSIEYGRESLQHCYTRTNVASHKRKEKNHVVTQEPTVNSRDAPQEPVANMGK